MPYPPTSPYGGPNFASEFAILEGIACNVQAFNVGAGGAAYPINATSTFTLLASIDCNLCNTVGALGGTGCTGGYDGVMGLLMSIACNSKALTSIAGGTPDAGYYTYNPFGLWAQIACNFGATATATGTPSVGGGFDSIWNLMIAVYCATKQIADNGFTPAELFHFKAGDRPAGSIFSRAGEAFELANSAPPISSPGWYTVTNPQGIIFAVGDSVTLGATAIESYFPKVQRQYASKKRLHNSNLGVNSAYLSNSGSAATDMDAIIAAYVDPVFASMKGVAIVFGGSNDMFLGSVDGAVAFARLQAVCNQIRVSHTHVKIVVVTILPRQNNGGFEAWRQQMRTLMLAGDPSYDYVADWGGNATMAANAAASTNLTYYSDQIHPTNAGHIIGASIIGPVVQTALAAAGL